MGCAIAVLGYLFAGACVLMLLGVMPTKAPWEPWQYVASLVVGYALVWLASQVMGRKRGDRNAG